MNTIKKSICLMIALIALNFVSCAKNTLMPTQSEYQSTTSTTSATAPHGTSTAAADATATLSTQGSTGTTATTSNSGVVVPNEPFAPSGFSNLWNTHYIETKSKILFLQSMTGVGVNVSPLYYFSKADGELYPFCFDPLCQHDDGWIEKRINCIGCAMNSQLARPRANADPVYLNSRFYFVYLDSIYSCSEFATDLRVEFSFHEYDNLSYDEIVQIIMKGYYAICDFCGYGSALLFKHIDENGNVVQFIFDTKTKKVSNLTDKIKNAGEKLGVSLYISKFTNEKLYLEAYTNVKSEPSVTGSFKVTGDYMGCYEADYEIKEINKIDFRFPINPIFKTQNAFIYSELRGDKLGLFSINFDGKETAIFENYKTDLKCNNAVFLYITDDSLFYYANDPVEVGNDESLYGKMRQNISGGKIYRYDLKSNKIQLVFDNLKYDYFEIYYIGDNDKTVLLRVQKYEKMSETKVKTTGGVIIKGTLDANGNFVDLEEVELE